MDAQSAALVDRAGGWLRNPIRLDRITCAVCTTPSPGYTRCYPCHSHATSPGHRLADRVAPMTYARPRDQSGYVMRAYKAPNAPRGPREIVALLSLVALGVHLRCPGLLAGNAVTHWSAVPSLPAKPGRHPLGAIIDRIMDLPEVPLAAAARVANARVLSADHFQAAPPAGGIPHVLLIDDTWVSGGHAQSAALALRAGGAAEVSVLVLARWLKDYGDNRRFVAEELTRDYAPSICPWTGGECPSEQAVRA